MTGLLRKPTSAFLLVAMILWVSCERSPRHERADITLHNGTTQSFAWATVFIGDNKIEFGVLDPNAPVGGGATYMYFDKPITEQVRVKLIDTNHKTNEFVVSVKGVYDPKRVGELVLDVTPTGVIPRFDPL